MLKKPILLIIFSLFLITEPIFRLALMAIEKDFSILDVLKKTFDLGPLDSFNFWFLFPISGFLLLSIKPASYILFVLIQIYSLFFHISYESFSWPYLSSVPSPSALALLGINLLITIYMLLPKTRKTFFDENLRWWERGSRYSVNEPAYISSTTGTQKGFVVDLSNSGALIHSPVALEVYSTIDLSFELLGKNLEFEAIVKRIPKEDEKYYGVQFKFKNFIDRYSMNFLIMSVQKSGEYKLYRK